MGETELNYITDILQNRRINAECIDWYSVLGFLELNRIGGYFYGKIKDMEVPETFKKALSALLKRQTARNALMGERLAELTEELEKTGIRYVVLKGNFLSHANFVLNDHSAFYGSGERVSNDIDILVSPQEIGKVEKVLSALGYVQGYYDAERGIVSEISRREILERRMNRGETVPFQFVTGKTVLPHVEIDINFSLDHLPSGTGEILKEMLERAELYAADCGTIRSLEKIDFLVHLIMHQYKEMCVYWMVARGKDLELYKLLDIYLLLKETDGEELRKRIDRYGIAKQAEVVLKCVKDVFDDAKTGMVALSAESERVIEYGKRIRMYEWTAGVRERLLFTDHTGFLKEIREEL